MAERFPTASEEEHQQALDEAESQIHAGLIADPKCARRMTILVSPSPETSCTTKQALALGANADLVDATVMMFQPIKEQFPILTDCEFSSLVARVGTEVTSGLEVPINSGRQGGNDDVRISVDPPTESAGRPSTESANVALSTRKLAPALLLVALLTVVMDLGTMLYKPPRGVVFGRNKLAYYLTLIGIFVSGAAEVLTALWLSRSNTADGQRRLSFGRAVLCASILPFVAIVAIDGFAFIEG